jgi:hypothetical protein
MHKLVFLAFFLSKKNGLNIRCTSTTDASFHEKRHTPFENRMCPFADFFLQNKKAGLLRP